MIRTILVATLLFVVSVSLCQGMCLHKLRQWRHTPTPEDKTGKVAVVATVNLTDATVVQDGNKFNITFTVSNRVGTQPGIKYGVMLVQNTAVVKSFLTSMYLMRHSL